MCGARVRACAGAHVCIHTCLCVRDKEGIPTVCILTLAVICTCTPTRARPRLKPATLPKLAHTHTPTHIHTVRARAWAAATSNLPSLPSLARLSCQLFPIRPSHRVDGDYAAAADRFDRGRAVGLDEGERQPQNLPLMHMCAEGPYGYTDAVFVSDRHKDLLGVSRIIKKFVAIKGKGSSHRTTAPSRRCSHLCVHRVAVTRHLLLGTQRFTSCACVRVPRQGTGCIRRCSPRGRWPRT